MRIILGFVIACYACQALAVPVSSGTGFFVSRRGELVTNAHVIAPCENKERIYFRHGRTKPQAAELITIDANRDLALLRASMRPNRVAALRWMHTKIQEKQKVFLLGYPQTSDITGPYSTAYATIKAVQGPQGEAQWLQFTDSARNGNSGGPLLDFGGNVVGVVTAKSYKARENKLAATMEIIDESDIAVTAYELKQFLDQYRVHYTQSDSLLILNERRLEQLASDYVVHIFCAVEDSEQLRF